MVEISKKDLSGDAPARDFKFEIIGFFLLLMAGVLPRLAFVTAYPNHPLSDFYNIFNLAQSFEQDVLARGNIYWKYFSAGLPFILSILFRVVPYPSEDVARWATAVISGLPAVAPFLIWRGVFSRRVRVLSGLLLAFWPGQILFSGVLAQDNWIIFPTVCLAALAVRALVQPPKGYPIWAGLFYSFAVAIRQEMLIALLPLAAVAMLGSQKEKWLRNFLTGGILVGVLFGVLIVHRGMATGRYTLSTDHLGVSILGAYVPGAGLGWISPIPYLAANYPDLLNDKDFEQKASGLVWQEFARRPGFHIIRMVGSSFYNLFNIDREVSPWSLVAEGALPHRYRKSAAALYERMDPVLEFYPWFIHGLFLSAVFFSFTKRDLLIKRDLLKWISPILLAIVLKVGLHAAIVSQPRYFLVVVAMEIMIISIILDAMLKKENRTAAARSVAAGVLVTGLLLGVIALSKQYIQSHDLAGSVRADPASVLLIGPPSTSHTQGLTRFVKYNQPD